MEIQTDSFRVEEDQPIELEKWPTRVDSFYGTKKEYKQRLKYVKNRLQDLQNRLYAEDSLALLVIFQGMDTAGKDSTIREVFSGVDPHGIETHSFKQPTSIELQHDFLWRTAMRLPERGRIGIFNRSYYEEVLVVRVHPEILRNQRLPPSSTQEPYVWEQRFESIREHEKHIYRSGTHILKFFLHLSHEEQRKRFLRRIDEAEKNWKFNKGDVKERASWPAYQQAYEEAIGATSTTHAPWYVIPADNKRNARLIIANIVAETLDKMDLKFPVQTPERHEELEEMRRVLLDEAPVVSTAAFD